LIIITRFKPLCRGRLVHALRFKTRGVQEEEEGRGLFELTTGLKKIGLFFELGIRGEERVVAPELIKGTS